MPIIWWQSSHVWRGGLSSSSGDRSRFRLTFDDCCLTKVDRLFTISCFFDCLGGFSKKSSSISRVGCKPSKQCLSEEQFPRSQFTQNDVGILGSLQGGTGCPNGQLGSIFVARVWLVQAKRESMLRRSSDLRWCLISRLLRERLFRVEVRWPWLTFLSEVKARGVLAGVTSLERETLRDRVFICRVEWQTNEIK